MIHTAHFAPLFTLGILSIAPAAAAQSTQGPGPADPPSSNAAMQRFLAESDARFQEFLRRHPGAWIPVFDEDTKAILSLVGRGIPVSARPIVNIADAKRIADEILKNESYLWGAPVNELVPAASTESGQIYQFTWTQRHEGLEVLGARVEIQIHKSGRVCLLGGTALEITKDLRSIVKITADNAAAVVKKGKININEVSANVTDLAIFVRRGGGAAEPRPAFVVMHSQPARRILERVLVDAETGAILEVRSLVHDANDVHGNATGAAWTGLSISSGTTVAAIPNATISVLSNSGATASGTTGATGNFNISMPDAGPHTATLTLNGPYYNIINSAGGSVSVSGAATPDGSGGFVVNLDANPAPTEETTAQVSAAVLHHFIREYVISKLPTYAPAFPQQKVYVNENSTCNAYFDTSDDSIHFFHSGGSCVNTCYSTVMYHEFGHGVDEYYGHILSSGLSEGVADVVAMYATNQSLVGQDFFGPGTAIRNGENGVSWPATGCNFEPHCMGESYMGFAWLARKNLILSLGQTAGAAVAEADMLGSIPPNPVSIPLAVQQAFLMDDNDGDLTNGTPHFNELSAAALAKGFAPPVAVGLNITHIPHPDTAGQTRDYPVYLDISALPGITFGSAHVEYSDNDGASWNSINATLTATPGRYRAAIPAHTAPAVIHYRIVVSNSTGATVILPEGDNAHRFAVGAKTTVLFDNFETGGAAWTHGANLGNDDWIISNPANSSVAPLLLDPPAAFSGTLSAGTDLSQSGKDGLYEANVDTWFQSPAISGAGLNNLRLRFRRWLSVEGSQYDHARVWLAGGASQLLWTNGYQPEHIDPVWTLQDMPATAANGAGSFNVKFTLDSDAGLEFGGWNLDDVEVYNIDATPAGTFGLSVNNNNPPIGSTLTFNSAGDPFAYFEIYASPTDGPVAVDGFGVAEVGADAIFFYNGILDGSGQHSISFELPNNPAFIGFEIDAIGYELVPGGLPQLGNAVKLIIN